MINTKIDSELQLINILDNEVKSSKVLNDKIKADLADEESKDHDLK